MTRSFVLGLLAVTALTAPAASTAAQVLTLESLETGVATSHPTMQRRRAELRVAETRIDAARAEMRPSLYLDVGVTGSPGLQVVSVDRDDSATGTDLVYVSGTRAFGNDDGRSPLQPFFRYAAGLRFDGPLYDFGRTAARVDAARAEAAVTGSQADASREDLVRGTRVAYLRWLGAYEQRKIVETSLAIATERAEQTAESVRLGVRPGSDRDLAAYEVSRLRLTLARARADEDDLRAELGNVARVEIPAEAIPDEQWLGPVAADVRPPAPAALATLELQRAAVGASMRAYRRRYNPVLAVSVRLGASAQTADGTLRAFPAYSVQIGLSMPLWDPRLGSHLRRQAEAQDEALAAAQQDLLVQAESERSRAMVSLERANEQLVIATESTEIATRIAANVEERYRATGGSMDAVLTARQREIAAQTEKLAAEMALAAARLRLRPIPTAD